MPDHVHMMISVPPKYSVAQVIGYMMEKESIHIARVYAGPRKNFVGQNFWTREYWVSSVEKDEAAVRRYIREQEKGDKRLAQINLMAL